MTALKQNEFNPLAPLSILALRSLFPEQFFRGGTWYLGQHLDIQVMVSDIFRWEQKGTGFRKNGNKKVNPWNHVVLKLGHINIHIKNVHMSIDGLNIEEYKTTNSYNLISIWALCL